MMKNYKSLLLSATLLALTFKANAQVSNYVFSQFSATYTAISGGTVFGSTTSDDQVFVDPTIPLGSIAGATGPGMPIGFTFVFNNIPFDRIGINNNGWIFFGQSTLTPAVNSNNSSGYVGISGTSTAPGNLQHRVAAFSRDIQAQAGADLRIETSGTTPNQVCVIQWNNYRKFNATGDIMNFQIRLYETSNVVEIVYGNFVNNATAATCEVGLRGATNTDFNNRIVNTTTGWASSIQGTAANSNCAFNALLVPATGQVYRWTPPPPCSGTPPANQATSMFTMICPNGSANLSLTTTYTTTGNTYQWLSSNTSSVGPFTPIASATSPTLAATNLTLNTWFQVAVTCTNSSSTINSGVHGVLIAGTTVNNIPYNESFEGIIVNNQLPNCSWSVSSTSICQTYTTAQLNNRVPRSGAKFGSFRSGTNAAGDYFYTNGLQMEPGVTYSAAVWYLTDGNIGWSNLSLLLGTSQATSALTTSIASTSGPPSGLFYQLLSGTFTVPNSGIYHLALRCVGNSSPQFLTFDDISVTIPCQLNTPTVTATTGNATICSGASALLSASGANTYTWSTGATNYSVSVSPLFNTTYMVTGTSSLTSCTGVYSIHVFVNQTPNATILALSNSVCLGSPVTLYGFGGNTTQWSTGGNGPSIVVTPTANTTYTLLVAGNGGCIGTATTAISVKQLPLVFAQTSNSGTMCLGENTSLIGSGTGVVSYMWSSNNVNIFSQTALVSPNITTSYTLTGTDANGCENTAVINLVVNPCTSIDENDSSVSLLVYPNPTSGSFVIQTGSTSEKVLMITDISGKLISAFKSSEPEVKFSLDGYSNGVYYASVNSGGFSKVVKIVKH